MIYVKSTRGYVAGSCYFNGEILKAEPNDVYPKIWICEKNTFQDLENEGLIKSVGSINEANALIASEDEYYKEDVAYAREAEREEEKYL